MNRFNPLDHSICLVDPERIAASAWMGHTPFAMWLVSALRPRLVVELGTYTGVSYCAFCQAVKELKLNARCYAVDTWRGDQQTGVYGEEVFDELRRHHDARYSDFSALINSTFDEALARFTDHSIDLLHIDGAHQYENAKHDFESWLPKLSDRGIALMHDIDERGPGFGVFQLWQELKTKYPAFEFHHEHGLGVLAVGPNISENLCPLFSLSKEEADAVRRTFDVLGQRVSAARDLDESARRYEGLAREISARDRVIDELAGQHSLLQNSRTEILNSRSWRWISRYRRWKAVVQGKRREVNHATNGQSGRPSNYEEWIRRYDTLTETDRGSIARRIQAFASHPRISVIIFTSESGREFLSATVASVRRQLYENWELLWPETEAGNAGAEFGDDPRIMIVTKEKDHDSIGDLNRALALARGEFVAVVRAGDEIAEHALYLIVEDLNRFAGVDVFYGDDDEIDAAGLRSNPNFKPDWNFDLFRSVDFMTPFTVYRSSVLKQVGGFKGKIEESAVYDLALRAVEHIPTFRIRHLPHVLCHRRDRNDSGRSDGDGVKAVADHLARAGTPAVVTNGQFGVRRVQYPLAEPEPLVSVIIATRDRIDLLRGIVSDAFERTDYQRLELIVVDNQTSDPETLSYLNEVSAAKNISVVSYDAPFNFSAINNQGARAAHGEVIAFVNNDVRVISRDWLREMVSHAMRREIGAVGAKLYYENDSIQHAGIILGLGGLAGYVQRYAPRDNPGHGSRLLTIQNYSAVTAACMVLRRSVFDEVAGFDEANLPVAYNDVDLCLRIRERGYRILWTPYAELYHIESASRADDLSEDERARYHRECEYLKKRWGSQLAYDPYYNPNLTIAGEDFSLASPPRLIKPWLH